MSNSPEQITATPNQRAPKKLPKKCWREEYIRILEHFEYPPPYRAPISEPQDTFEKVTFHALLRDLEDAGLICASHLASLSVPNRITYFGRLELERLKSERAWPKFWKSSKTWLCFVMGALFNAFLAAIQPIIVSWFLARSS